MELIQDLVASLEPHNRSSEHIAAYQGDDAASLSLDHCKQQRIACPEDNVSSSSLLQQPHSPMQLNEEPPPAAMQPEPQQETVVTPPLQFTTTPKLYFHGSTPQLQHRSLPSRLQQEGISDSSSTSLQLQRCSSAPQLQHQSTITTLELQHNSPPFQQQKSAQMVWLQQEQQSGSAQWLGLQQCNTGASATDRCQDGNEQQTAVDGVDVAATAPGTAPTTTPAAPAACAVPHDSRYIHSAP